MNESLPSTTEGRRDPDSSSPEHRFAVRSLQGAEVIVQADLALMWAKKPIKDIVTPMSRAENEIEGMNVRRYAGFSDWRLPTLEEAESLLGERRVLSISETTGSEYTSYLDPRFPHPPEPGQVNCIWTTTLNESGSKAFVCDFSPRKSELCSRSAHGGRALAVRSGAMEKSA